MPIANYGANNAFDYEDVAVSTSVVTLTADKYQPVVGAPADVAIIQAEGTVGEKMRFRTDGGAPTSSVGHYLEAGTWTEISGIQNIANFKAIRDAGATSNLTLHVTYTRSD